MSIMATNTNAVAIIPARGGSKRIPRKNIRDFCGKPIIAYSIETAKASFLFKHIYVSTEDSEIAEISTQYGAAIIDRPSRLADDYTSTVSVIRHAIEWLETQNTTLDFVCCIYPTTPFLCPEDLIMGFDIITTEDSWEFVLSATEYSYPTQRSFQINDNGGIEMCYPDHFKSRTQDLETRYHDADKFYWGTCPAWMSRDNLFSSRSAVVKVPHYRTQVIDSENDWKLAETKYRALR